MSFGGQPYIHCPPSRQSGYAPQSTTFDPKAYTRASFAPRSSTQSQQNGSLLDFNRHPDSYLILPYGQTNAIPLGPNAKRKIKAVRWLQFAFRILNMVAALGMLVCVVCLTNVEGTESWVMRLIPAADILCTTYALYHLLRNSRARTPASSASYHWFALLTDACFIPLYAYTVVIDRSRLGQSKEAEDSWRSLFKNEAATVDLITAIWIGSIALGGIHLFCCSISLYLACMFRKIANLPPDMNPLEDNLTSRRGTKHKHKSSELSTSEKHDSTISFASSGRISPAKAPGSSEQPMSFIGTRTADATQLYSPHNPVTANASRTHLPLMDAGGMYAQPHSAQVSRIDFAAQSKPKTGLSRMLSVAASSIYSRSSNSEQKTPPLPRKSSKRTSSSFESSKNWYAIHEDDDENHDGRAPSISIIEEDSDDDDNIFAPPRADSSGLPGQNTRYYAQKYHAVPQRSQLERSVEGDLGTGHADSMTAAPFASPGLVASAVHMDPLHMNPPTPPPGTLRPASQRERDRKQVPRAPTPHDSLRVLAATSGNASRAPPFNGVSTSQSDGASPTTKASHLTHKSQPPTPSPPPSTTPAAAPAPASPVSAPPRDSPSPSKHKGKYYGDLASAVNGVRNTPPSSPSKLQAVPVPVSAPLRTETKVEPGWGIGAWLAGVGPGAASTTSEAKAQSTHKKTDQRQTEHVGEDALFEDVVLSGTEPQRRHNQLSVDEARIREGDARRRVSGKVVEEGLAPSNRSSVAGRWGLGGGGWSRSQAQGRVPGQVGKGIRVVDDGVTGKRMDERGRVISRSGVDYGS